MFRSGYFVSGTNFAVKIFLFLTPHSTQQIWWDVIMDWGLLVGSGTHWRLRQRRLYPSKTFYWGLICVNALLRFGWTLTLVPTRYLSAAGVLMRDQSVTTPLLASAEIIRRSLWALVRVEWESVKDAKAQDDIEDKDEAMLPMQQTGAQRRGLLSDMSMMANTEILGELCLYTSTFAVLGIVIAAHRDTM